MTDARQVPSSARVLVCDDDADFRALAERTLTQAGCRVDVATDAADALARQRQRSYPVQLLDLELPDLSGLELARAIRADDPVSVLIAITAHRRAFDVVDARDAGFDDLFFKPISPQELTALILDALARTQRWSDAVNDNPRRDRGRADEIK